MSKGYMSIHHQGYAGHGAAYRVRYVGITRVGAFEVAQTSPHTEAPNVLPIGLICSARLP